MAIITIQRPDNRTPCREGWVPLAQGVEAQISDYGGETIVCTTPFMAAVRPGHRVLIDKQALEIVSVDADDRRSLTLILKRSTE